MRIKFFSIALFVFCISVSATAQTSRDLQAKYGKAFDAFYVRPNILMTVEYTIDGQMLEAIIESRHSQKMDGKSSVEVGGAEMLPETVTEIIEEILPANERGKRGNRITFNASCSTLESEIYEKVEIYKTYTCSSVYKESKVITTARIRWKLLK